MAAGCRSWRPWAGQLPSGWHPPGPCAHTRTPGPVRRCFPRCPRVLPARLASLLWCCYWWRCEIGGWHQCQQQQSTRGLRDAATLWCHREHPGHHRPCDPTSPHPVQARLRKWWLVAGCPLRCCCCCCCQLVAVLAAACRQMSAAGGKTSCGLPARSAREPQALLG